jgi:hypothetical protein
MRRSYLRSTRPFQFERLEKREVLDAESFNLIGVTDYFNNPIFDDFDGRGSGETPYRIAVISSGADVNHDVFGNDANQDGAGDRIAYRWNFLDDNSNVTDTDRGTAYAGLIAEMAPGVELIILKAHFAGDPDVAAPFIADALEWVEEEWETYNIVAVHLPSYDPGQVYTSAVVGGAGQTTFVNTLDGPLADLNTAGIPVITQSGDLFGELISQEGVTYPAASPYVISVGGVWDNNEGIQQVHLEPQHTGPDQVMAKTNRGSGVLDLMAPGALIEAAIANGNTTDWFGTGLAAAHVAAAVALAQDMSEHFNGERLDNDELEMLFEDTAKNIFDGDDETDQGPGGIEPTDEYYNRLDVEAMAYKLFKPSTAPDLVAGSDWGFSNTDNATGDSTPTFTGTAPPNSHVWLYFGTTAVANGAADSNGAYSLTPSAQALSGSWSVTIRVAADSTVAEANRSQASPALTVTHSEYDDVGTESFSAKVSDSLTVSGSNATSTSRLTIDWTTSPTTLTKTDTGALTVSSVGGYFAQAITFNANAGTTSFTTDTGVAGIPGTSSRVANWTINADATVNFTTSQNLAALNVLDGGLVAITAATPPNYKLLYVSSLEIFSGGKLDITNNGMVIDYSASLTGTEVQELEDDLRGWLISGRGGTGLGKLWNGSTGIVSGTAYTKNSTTANSRSIGYAVNSSLPSPYTTFLGQTVDGSSFVIRYTVTADFNLDGTVWTGDSAILGAYYNPNSENAHWGHGDADYDGYVENDDSALLGAFWGNSLES